MGSNDALNGGQTYGVTKILRYSNYTGQLYNDVAMIKITPKLVFTPAVNRVTLPYYSPVPGYVGNLTGYGSNEVHVIQYLNLKKKIVVRVYIRIL